MCLINLTELTFNLNVSNLKKSLAEISSYQYILILQLDCGRYFKKLN